MRPAALSLVSALLLSLPALADVTMRSKIDYHLGSFVPAAAAETVNKQMGESLANGVTLRIKGKRSLMAAGPTITIVDNEKGTLTLIDPKGKRYATTNLADYGEKVKAAMPQLPEAARQMLENLKFDVKTDKTGKTQTIKGIKTEEMVTTVTVEGAGPMAAMSMKMEMHMWAAAPEELERVPALKEIAAYMKNQAAGTDPSSTAAKMFGQMPGLADKLKGPMEEMIKSSSQAVLRSEMKMMMPGSAKMMGASNPDEPFMDMVTELAELSTDPIPDSAFQVPADYQEGKIEDVLQAMNPARPGQQPPAPQPPPAAPQGENQAAAADGVRRVGNGVIAPKLIRRTSPEYTEEARQARVQGDVKLYVQVNREGRAENIRVLESLDRGLDAKAIEAVKQWEFAPGTKDGRPVTVEAQVMVSFHLLDR
jgi:TonB family protein